MQYTGSDAIVKFVFYSGMVVLTISLLMMVFVLIFRLWSIRRARLIKEFSKRWSSVLDMDETVPAILPSLKEEDKFLLLKLWCDRFEVSSGAGKESLLLLAEHLKLLYFTYDMLGHKSGDYIMLAMRAAGYLKKSLLWWRLVELLKHPSPLFSMLAARALIMISPAEAVELLMPLFVSKKDWPSNKILLILKGTDENIITSALLEAVEYTPKNSLPRLIKFFALMHERVAYEKAKELLARHSDPEIIAACLHYMRSDKDKKQIISYIKSNYWVVRMHAVKALASMITKDDIDKLLGLLSDSVWWVRHHAAKAIVSQEFMDEKHLDDLSSALSDKYAKDALRYARSQRLLFERL